jgi:hypothetical protein
MFHFQFRSKKFLENFEIKTALDYFAKINKNRKNAAFKSGKVSQVSYVLKSSRRLRQIFVRRQQFLTFSLPKMFQRKIRKFLSFNLKLFNSIKY